LAIIPLRGVEDLPDQKVKEIAAALAADAQEHASSLP
jgi:hypothetical protein